jgi:hypothetical protein
MKFIKTVMIALMVMFVPVAVSATDPGYMRTSLIEGDVQIKTPDAEEWGLASLNGPLAEGDQVWAPEDARTELQLNNGTYLRLDHDSSLQILSMDRDSSQFYLAQGGAYVLYDAPEGSVMQIDTPDASVRVFNGAIFRIDISDRYTDVTVYKGYVRTENDAGETRINAGMMLSLGQDTYGELAPIAPADEWEEWNNARNRRVMADRDSGSRYLPAELRVYSADLDDNGRWVRDSEYGYVWTPTVDVGAGWAPYRAGRWIWRGGDYVWIGHEPWGWAPYHYGRWAFVARFGWCWVPPVAGDVFWSPGYVGWVRTPDYVAWVPLAPGERYYGRGNYGRHSVNITNVNINQVNVTNVYRNVSISNGVTVVNRNTFNTGSPTLAHVNRDIIRQKIFVRNNISFGAPAIKPGRGSYFASNRTVPTAKLPPQPIRNLRPREIKSSRPFIREPDRSVRGGGGKVRSLRVTTVEKPRTPGKERPSFHNMPPAANSGKEMPTVPGRRSERPQARPAERVQPLPPGAVPSKTERPQALPGVRREPLTPGSLERRGERPSAQPVERREPVQPGRPVPRGERPQVQQPAGRVQPVIPGAAPSNIERAPAQVREPVTPRWSGRQGEQPHARPMERVQPVVTPAAVPPKVEIPPAQPVERREPVPSVRPERRGERPQMREPTWRVQPVKPGAALPQGERPQVRPIERVKPVTPLGAEPKVLKPHAQPTKKEETGAARAREEKKPGEHDEDSQRSR